MSVEPLLIMIASLGVISRAAVQTSTLNKPTTVIISLSMIRLKVERIMIHVVKFQCKLGNHAAQSKVDSRLNVSRSTSISTIEGADKRA